MFEERRTWRTRIAICLLSIVVCMIVVIWYAVSRHKEKKNNMDAVFVESERLILDEKA